MCETNGNSFIGSGVHFNGPYGDQVITAEHLFQTSRKPGAFGIRFLRPLSPRMNMVVTSIVAKSEDFDGDDITILTVTTNKSLTNIIAGFTHVNPEPIITISESDGITAESGKTIKSVKSMVTGEEFAIVGVSFSDTETNKVSGVIVDCRILPGESGSGFIDSEGSLYIVNIGEKAEEGRHSDIYKTFQRKVGNFSIISTPLKVDSRGK